MLPKNIFTLITLFFSIPTLLYSQTAKTTLKAGTSLKVSPLYDISSKDFKEGQNVNFICTENIMVNNTLVIQAKSPVFAVIQKAEKAKSLGKEGSLRVSFKNIIAVDGQLIPLWTEDAYEEGKNTSKSIAGLMLISPFFMLKKGKNAILTKDQIMEAFVAKDTEINVK